MIYDDILTWAFCTFFVVIFNFAIAVFVSRIWLEHGVRAAFVVVAAIAIAMQVVLWSILGFYATH